MAVLIGSARIDEYGRISGGQAGDQKQTAIPDYKGEVSQQNFYVHQQGWYVIRPKDPALANKIAERMVTACNNKNLGYDQSNRLGVIQYGINTTTPTECDCSSLVRACIKEASGKDPGNFRTVNQPSMLAATGLFEQYFVYKSGMTLYTGDILVTKGSGHTVIVTQGASRTGVVPTQTSTVTVDTSTKVESAKYGPDKTVSGIYKTTADLNLRLGAGQNKKVLKVLKKGTSVRNYGYYNVVNGTKWLLVVAEGTTGYCSSKYLTR